MKRSAIAVLSLALAGPLTFAAAQSATADTTQTSSCTDGGGHLWQARTVWGKTYTEADGTTRVINNDVSFTTADPDVTTVDYRVSTYDGDGQVVRTYRRYDVPYDFAGGTRYSTVDPRNPPTDPGRSKIVLSVGDGNDGASSCRMTFVEPGAGETTPTPTESPTQTPTESSTQPPTDLPTQTPTESPTQPPTDLPTQTPTESPTQTPTDLPTQTPTEPSTVPAGSTCEPGQEVVKFAGQGSAGLAQYGQGDYDASAELWNVGGYSYEQTMGVCSHDAWYVDVKTDDSERDGAVKAYPSMRRIYHDWGSNDFSNDPLVSSFPRLEVDFAATDPGTCPGCIYDTAFDIWLNGIGDGDANELMIWTHNVGQTPYGTKVASGISLEGHTWDLYSGNSNHYLAFVPTDTSNIPSGRFDVKAFTGYLADHDRISTTSRLGQISYGVETVSTGAVSRHWDFTRFTIADS